MNLRTNLTIDMSATGASRWADLRNMRDVSLQVDCGAVASPVGVVTVEFSNDVETCEREIKTDVAPTSTTAVKVDCTAALTVRGTAFSNGFDGSGNKASFTSIPVGMPAFARVKYTRTSGGSGDTLHVRFVGR